MPHSKNPDPSFENADQMVQFIQREVNGLLQSLKERGIDADIVTVATFASVIRYSFAEKGLSGLRVLQAHLKSFLISQGEPALQDDVSPN